MAWPGLAKGALAERLGLAVNEAFALLRGEARARNQRLSDLAKAVVEGSEQLQEEPDETPR